MTMRPLLRRPRAAALAALAAAVTWLAAPANASSAGTALVIGIGTYAGRPVLPSCSQTAHLLSGRLRRLGFTVEEQVDEPAAAVREAVTSFAGSVPAATSPAPLIFVCGEATSVGERLFLLPSDVDLQQPLHPETQGVVVRALLNALADTSGTLIAEFGTPRGTDAAAASTALRDSLPHGLHLLLAIGDGRQAGTLGDRLSDETTPLDQGWYGIASALQAQPAHPAYPILMAAPLPTPPAPAPAPAPLPPAVPPPAQVPPVARSHEVPPPLLPDDGVRRLQAALARRGFYRGPVDGLFQTRTLGATRSFQASLGDSANGVLTQAEIVELLRDR